MSILPEWGCKYLQVRVAKATVEPTVGRADVVTAATVIFDCPKCKIVDSRHILVDPIACPDLYNAAEIARSVLKQMRIPGTPPSAVLQDFKQLNCLGKCIELE